jgi:hypothetical protein
LDLRGEQVVDERQSFGSRSSKRSSTIVERLPATDLISMTVLRRPMPGPNAKRFVFRQDRIAGDRSEATIAFAEGQIGNVCRFEVRRASAHLKVAAKNPPIAEPGDGADNGTLTASVVESTI